MGSTGEPISAPMLAAGPPAKAAATTDAPCTRREATAKCWNPHLRSDRCRVRRAFERGRIAESPVCGAVRARARASRMKPPAANAETASRLGGGPRGQLLLGESQARQSSVPRLRPVRSWTRGAKTNSALTPISWARGAMKSPGGCLAIELEQASTPARAQYRY